MSPAAENKEGQARCFPRVSGDEPGSGYMPISGFLFSPRERG